MPPCKSGTRKCAIPAASTIQGPCHTCYINRLRSGPKTTSVHSGLEWFRLRHDLGALTAPGKPPAIRPCMPAHHELAGRCRRPRPSARTAPGLFLAPAQDLVQLLPEVCRRWQGLHHLVRRRQDRLGRRILSRCRAARCAQEWQREHRQALCVHGQGLQLPRPTGRILRSGRFAPVWSLRGQRPGPASLRAMPGCRRATPSTPGRSTAGTARPRRRPRALPTEEWRGVAASRAGIPR